jgi:hypothetical protein
MLQTTCPFRRRKRIVKSIRAGINGAFPKLQFSEVFVPLFYEREKYMKNSKAVKIGCLLVLAFTVILGFLKGIWLPFGLVAALHLVEFIIVGKKTGAAAGMNFAASFCNCMLFGFSWWMPLRGNK